MSSIGNIGHPVTMRDLGIDEEGIALTEEVAKRAPRAPP